MLYQPRAYAFFDVDDTLISIKSMFSFQEYWYRMAGDARSQAVFETEMAQLRQQQAPWEDLNRRYYASFAGREVMAVERCASAWYAHVERTTPALYHSAIVAQLRMHQCQAEEPVFVSGSFPALLKPVAARLDVHHILATRLEVVGGRYTGEILPPQTIGQGKATAIAAFLKHTGVPADICHAYGDDISDLPMLNAVGHPAVVRGGRGLEDHAAKVGWRVLSPA